MPLVFTFLSLDVTGLHGQREVETFKGLDAGHLIGARHMGARRGEHWGGLGIVNLQFLLDEFSPMNPHFRPFRGCFFSHIWACAPLSHGIHKI